MIVYLCLLAVALVAGALGVYVGRITAPECELQHHQTQIMINRARLTKLDADGKPVGPSMDMPSGARQMTMTFEAEAVDPTVFDLLTGDQVRARVAHDSGRHHAVEADEEVTQVVPVADVSPEWPPERDRD
jgi:hypothetical protein